MFFFMLFVCFQFSSACPYIVYKIEMKDKKYVENNGY
jgi:hypothetical protein